MKKGKYVCLGNRFLANNKLGFVFYKLNADNSINEDEKLMFSESKKRKYFFRSIYEVEVDNDSYSLTLQKDEFIGNVKLYLIKSEEHKQWYYDIKNEEKIRKEKIRLEKDKISLDNLSFGELKTYVATKKISINTFLTLINSWKDKTQREYYEGKLK